MQNNIKTKDFSNHICLASFGISIADVTDNVLPAIPSNKVGSIISLLPGEIDPNAYYCSVGTQLTIDKDSRVIDFLHLKSGMASFTYRMAANAARCQIVDGRDGTLDLRNFNISFTFFLPKDKEQALID